MKGRPAIAAVRLNAPGDGVAYVARLVHRALHMPGEGPPRLAEVSPAQSTGPTPLEQFGFLLRLSAAQVRADWVFFTHLGLARAQRWVPSPVRRPYAVFLHGIEAWDPELSPSRHKAVALATLRIANSSYTATRVRATHPDVGDISVCPLALDPSDGRNSVMADGPVGMPDGSHTVIIVGRMSAAERYKGHDQLIECWGSVLRAVPDATLLIVGTGDDASRLLEKARLTGVGERIVFTGFIADDARDALLARAAVFAMPSRGEGFGIAYLQAMRMGVPCVGSRTDAAGDLIRDGVTGFLVDPGDTGELGARLVELLTNEPLRRRMGEEGRRRYHAEFTFDRFRARLLAAVSGHNGTQVRAS